MEPSRTMSAPMGTSFRFTPSRARSSALRIYCSSAARPVPTPTVGPSRWLSSCNRGLAGLPEREVSLRIPIDYNVVAFRKLAFEHSERERVLQQPLNRALQRSCTERGIVALRSQYLARRRRQLEGEFPIAHQLLESAKLQIDDMLDFALSQRTENDDVVDAIEELGTEMLSQRVGDLRLYDSAVVARVLEDVGAAD